MEIEAAQNALRVHFGKSFGHFEVTKVLEAVATLGPFSHVEIDFTAVRDSDDASLARLVGALASFDDGRVELRGLTTHQWRLLTLLKTRGTGPH